MGSYLFLVPVSLLAGLAGLGIFFWALRSGQYEDMHGDAARILLDAEDRPLRTDKPQE